MNSHALSFSCDHSYEFNNKLYYRIDVKEGEQKIFHFIFRFSKLRKLYIQNIKERSNKISFPKRIPGKISFLWCISLIRKSSLENFFNSIPLYLNVSNLSELLVLFDFQLELRKLDDIYQLFPISERYKIGNSPFIKQDVENGFYVLDNVCGEQKNKIKLFKRNPQIGEGTFGKIVGYSSNENGGKVYKN